MKMQVLRFRYSFLFNLLISRHVVYISLPENLISWNLKYLFDQFHSNKVVVRVCVCGGGGGVATERNYKAHKLILKNLVCLQKRRILKTK